jgi:hypothetical protein
MTLFKHRLNIIFAIFFASYTSVGFSQKWEDSVVRIFASKKQIDESSPWQYEEIKQQTYHGLYVEGGSVLTTAFAVQDAVQLEMLRFGESQKFPLTVQFVDYESNLALLSPEDPAGTTGLVPLKFVEELPLDSTVTILRARDNNQLVSIAATMQEIGIHASATSEYSFATYLLKTQQSALGWSEPIVRAGNVVGLGSGQDSQFFHAIPGAMITHFLEDFKSGSYKGFPAIGVQLDRLTSPEMRKMIGADGVKHGIRVSKVEPGSDFSTMLIKDDVLLFVDGVRINENGFYNHPLWGSVHLKYLINRKFAGDKIKLDILRQGKQMVIEGKLPRFNSNAYRIASFRVQNEEPHVIFGGFVFRELSTAFLKQWGSDWRNTAPYPMLYEYSFRNDFVEDPGRQRIIIISRVLADEFNRGYDVKNVIVSEINGVPVQSMADVDAALRTPISRNGVQYARIVLEYGEGEVVLSYDGLGAAHKRIASTYNVPKTLSFFSR